MSDLDRLRQEYADREVRFAGSDVYSLSYRPNLFMIQQRQRDLIAVLEEHDLLPLRDKTILEIGCGHGGVLQEWHTLGAKPANLHGIDLLPYRVSTAQRLMTDSTAVLADGRRVPYNAAAFDIVLQFTMLSSVLDANVRRHLAQEMVRVVKPDGVIISYDFWLNPTNAHTIGVTARMLRDLFPDCELTFRRVTLAPPIGRRLVPISWVAALILENLRFLNSHYIAVIRPTG
jgi:ubiquinone/menaquinone biosynthesis C-methylase UbiE